MSWSLISNVLSQLTANSPMPSAAALLADAEDLADRYDALIKEVGHHLTDEQLGSAEEAEVVRVLADLFGLGGGIGIDWGTVYLVERCTPSIDCPIVQGRVLHRPLGSREWCAFILGRRRNSDDVPLLLAHVRTTCRVLQDVLLRLDRAFAAFFRRLKAGETPGYPRFQGLGRYNSFLPAAGRARRRTPR